MREAKMRGCPALAQGARRAAAIRQAWEARDFAAMVGALTDAMIDTIALAGTPEEVRERDLSAWADVYETPLLWPSPFHGLDGVRRVVEALR